MSRPTTDLVRLVAKFGNVCNADYPEAAQELFNEIRLMDFSEVSWLLTEALRIIYAYLHEVAALRGHDYETELTDLLDSAIAARDLRDDNPGVSE